jgi:RNA-directed DNA polymerase
MSTKPSLYDRVCAFENLMRAGHRTLLEGRRYRGEGALFKLHYEKHLLQLHKELTSRSYRHGPYKSFTIYEPKQRTVLAAPLRDRLVHHALHDVVEPLIGRKFIHDNYACRHGKGTHAAILRAQHFLQANRYFSHLDVKKYFPSIDHITLKRILRQHFTDLDVLALFDHIINSTAPVHTGASDLFNPPPTPKGLPIGNLTSQFLANLYLNELDQHLKHDLKVHAYLRYMDDFVVFGNDRQQLVALERTIQSYCNERLALDLHLKGGVKEYTEGLGFLGFKLYRKHRRLKSVGVVRYLRTYKTRSKACATGALSPEALQHGLDSWSTHARFGNTAGLRKHLRTKYTMNILEDAERE